MLSSQARSLRNKNNDSEEKVGIAPRSVISYQGVPSIVNSAGDIADRVYRDLLWFLNNLCLQLQITSLRYSIKEGLHTCKTLAADLQLLSSTTSLGTTLPMNFGSTALDDLDASEPKFPNILVMGVNFLL